MLQRSSRLRSERDIKLVRSRGSVRSNALFRLHYLRRSVAQPSRAAVVVSQKVSKQAVVRNRVRRVAREVIRDWFAQKERAMDIVLAIAPAAKNVTSKLQRESLKELLSKVE